MSIKDEYKAPWSLQMEGKIPRWICDSLGGVVAELYPAADWGPQNARLMCAAPDMLDTLWRLHQELSQDPEHEDMVLLIHNTIAHARYGPVGI